MEVNDVIKLINGCLFNFRYFKKTDCSRCFVINPKQDINFQHYESILYRVTDSWLVNWNSKAEL